MPFRRCIHISVFLFGSSWFGNFCTAQTAPDFYITDTQGTSHSLYTDYLDQGQYVLLEFFNLGLDPCLALAPLYEDLYQDWGAGSGLVEFITVSDQDDNLMLNGCWVEYYDLTFPVAGIEGGGDEVFEQFTGETFDGFAGLPAYVLIHPDGSMDYDIREDDVETLLMLNAALESATGSTFIEPISNSTNRLYVDGRLLHGVTPNTQVQVFGLDGRLNATFYPNADTHLLELPSGIYIIQQGRHTLVGAIQP